MTVDYRRMYMIENTGAAKNGGQTVLHSGAVVLRICLAALFAALIASGAYIAVPLPVTPVPVSVQSLFAVLAGLTLGPVYGAAAVALYLFAGAIGAPVFAGAAGGFVRFLAPSGGYLWGYLLGACTAGLIAGTPKLNAVKGIEQAALRAAVPAESGTSPSLKAGLSLRDRLRGSVRIVLAALAGTVVIYLPGLLWLKHVSAGSWAETLVWGLTPFITGDLLKLVFAALIAPRLRRAVIRVLGVR
jgi:biotin transport system substrate-specific component